MFDLETTKFINSKKESAKIHARARALNAGKKLHPKNWEKTGYTVTGERCEMVFDEPKPKKAKGCK